MYACYYRRPTILQKWSLVKISFIYFIIAKRYAKLELSLLVGFKFKVTVKILICLFKVLRVT